MSLILGVSAFYHDSAAALVRDGEIVAAAQEERFSRLRHDRRFPVAAINYCLEEAFIEPDEIDAVAFYDNPVTTLDRIVRNAADHAPQGREQWCEALVETFSVKGTLKSRLNRALGCDRPMVFVDHHLAHAAAAYYPSPFDNAAVLTIDGVGEWSTTSIGVAQGERLELSSEIRFPHSLGLLYSTFTAYCGFKVNSGEYKLMGLAPYGEPRYADVIRDHLIDLRDDGSYRLDMDYFDYPRGDRMFNSAFCDLFGAPPRAPESEITRRDMDLAASVQKITEDAVLRLAQTARRLSGSANLALAGGVALNCVANGRLASAGIFDRIWVQPAAGDAGSAIGAAHLCHHGIYGAQRAPLGEREDRQQGSLLGPSYSNAEVTESLRRLGAVSHSEPDREARNTLVAKMLGDGGVVGYFAGRMEFGPRALGARSILADPRRPEAQSHINLKVKFRESFRPFAPAVLAERAGEYFDMAGESPYMLMVAPVLPSRRKQFVLDDMLGEESDMIRIVNVPRSDIPAVTHVDYSARVQTVSATERPDFHALLKAFDAATGCPVLVNTSFNVRGEPIVCTPEDAYRCFMRTGLDMLVIEDHILYKGEQPTFADDESWKEEFALD